MIDIVGIYKDYVFINDGQKCRMELRQAGVDYRYITKRDIPMFKLISVFKFSSIKKTYVRRIGTYSVPDIRNKPVSILVELRILMTQNFEVLKESLNQMGYFDDYFCAVTISTLCLAYIDNCGGIFREVANGLVENYVFLPIPVEMINSIIGVESLDELSELFSDAFSTLKFNRIF